MFAGFSVTVRVRMSVRVLASEPLGGAQISAASTETGVETSRCRVVGPEACPVPAEAALLGSDL